MFNLAKGFGTFPRALNQRNFLLLAPLLILLVAACSSGSDDPIISSEQEAGGPEYSAILITTDMAVGESRVMFGVVNREGMPVPGTTSEVGIYFLVPGEDARELKESVTANFVNWPTSVGGIFAANLDLDIGGLYEMDIDYTANDGTSVFAQASFILQDDSSTPAIGSPAPASVTHTAADAEHISHITSSVTPDLDLYQLSIHEALQ